MSMDAYNSGDVIVRPSLSGLDSQDDSIKTAMTSPVFGINYEAFRTMDKASCAKCANVAACLRSAAKQNYSFDLTAANLSCFIADTRPYVQQIKEL